MSDQQSKIQIQIQFTIMYHTEKLKILKFEKLKPANIWYKKMTNYYLIIEIIPD